MYSPARRFVLNAAAFALVGIDAVTAQPAKPAPTSRVEPGLEKAVSWKWRAVPSDPNAWGLELPTMAHLASATPPPAATQPGNQYAIYEVKRGDALFLISRRFGVSVDQIKQANGLTSDLIRAGQTLRIPPAPRATATPAPSAAKAKPASSLSDAELNQVRLQVFLDREQFSPGSISGKPGPAFGKASFLYQSSHDDAKDDAALQEKAKAALGEVFVRYQLKREDFRFISPPKAETARSGRSSSPSEPAAGRPSSPPITKTAPNYDQLVSSLMLAYRSPWEFVAERFHCSEGYLRTLNGNLPPVPGIGAEFRVPNVIPFEIENALTEPLQPQADPENPVTAAVVGLSQLNIYRRDKLVAVFPLSSARPGLRGRGTWTILGATVRPRLATLQEEWREQTRTPAPLFGSSTPTPTPTQRKRGLATEQFLPAGPRNPVGIIWIDLAKSDSPEPLPYGLHGTSIPDGMNTLESIGGFRLTNWDIVRAARLLPAGTPLEWRQ